MLKIINCINKNYKNKLKIFLDRRKLGKTIDTSIVSKIIKDIKKNKIKALIKYEKKFSKNTIIKLNINIFQFRKLEFMCLQICPQHY